MYMFNYKRLTFILLLVSFLLIITDSAMERQARRSLLSLANIVVEEGSSVTETAPSSFLDILETGRLGIYSFLDRQDDAISTKADMSSGYLSVLLTIAYYIILVIKFICGYVITFYPFLILFLYLFLTSRIFKKDEFGIDE